MNRDLIAQRCRAGGLGIHELAMQVWVDPVFMWEDPGSYGDDRIPLGVLRRLSRLLDVELGDLVEEPAPPPEDDGEAVPDDVRVEAALAKVVEGVTRDALAQVFGWPLLRVERALATLEARLRPSGRRLRQIGWHRYALGPNLAILSPEEQAYLARATAPKAVDQQEADALYQIVCGFTPLPRSGPGEATALNSLEARGLIRRKPGFYDLSDDVAFSLRLDH